MSNLEFTIWCNNDFTAAQERERDLLIKDVGSHRLLMFAPNQDGREGESRAVLRTADIAFGYPDAQAVADCVRLRWVQLNSAGYTSFDPDDIKQALTERGIVLTNSSDVYDEPCAQHLLAMISSLARGLPLALDTQRGDKSWPMSAMRPTLRLLNEQTVLILGFGAIARRLTELLLPLKMNLIAARREIRGGEPIPIIKASDVDEFLSTADHVVNILPANEQTNNFLNAERLAKLKPGAIVYNIGRGTTLDQTALMKELRTGRIAAAYLDVTDPEPLPPEHPLWETPNCYITPHLAGGCDREKERQIKHFLDNLRRFEQDEPLRNRLL
jgi:phosphoglycerate dehydrogenase-like enzyme